MTEHLTMEDLLMIAARATGQEVLVRDYGLLDSALARPRASVFGQDAYPDLYVKAAALLGSLCTNHALVDGHKRLAFAAVAVFLEINGPVLDVDEDAQHDFMIDVAAGNLADPEKVAERLRYRSTR
ncbi:MAG: type II toxin-antitoxin system death-on-curing family toxin [Actinomycetota bacterium]|nr:type II toxin-antitoxin system death-on-curing family toxin [Actinomycetota bacterium]